MPNEVGLSIRFIRSYDAEADRAPQQTMLDHAIYLAAGDDREDVTPQQKMADALAFIKSRIH